MIPAVTVLTVVNRQYILEQVEVVIVMPVVTVVKEVTSLKLVAVVTEVKG